MAARGVAHDRIRHLLDDTPTAEALASGRSGPSLRMAALGAAVCLLLLVVVLIL